jgi:hypothetical protein
VAYKEPLRCWKREGGVLEASVSHHQLHPSSLSLCWNRGEGVWERGRKGVTWRKRRGEGAGNGVGSDAPHSSELWRLSALGEEAGFESVAPSTAGWPVSRWAAKGSSVVCLTSVSLFVC